MGMEDETRDFLVKILQTISVVLLWMLANVFAGVYKNLGFFEGKPHWYNYVYYVVFLITLVLLIRYIRKKWEL